MARQAAWPKGFRLLVDLDCFLVSWLSMELREALPRAAEKLRGPPPTRESAPYVSSARAAGQGGRSSSRCDCHQWGLEVKQLSAGRRLWASWVVAAQDSSQGNTPLLTSAGCAPSKGCDTPGQRRRHGPIMPTPNVWGSNPARRASAVLNMLVSCI